MNALRKHSWYVFLSLFSAVCTIYFVIKDSIPGFIVCLAITILLFVVASREKSERTKTGSHVKKWIDCAYCDHSGTIVREQIANSFGETTYRHEDTCGVCGGRGKVYTDRWNQPDCRRCNGAGKLRSTSSETVAYMGNMPLNRPLVSYTACEVCDGVGKIPFHPEEE